jgi:hypothetical protein
MGVSSGVVRAETHFLEKIGDPFLSLLFGGDAENVQRLGDNLLNSSPGIKGSIRVLKNNLHISPDGTHLLVVKFTDILAFEEYFSLAGFNQSQNGPGRGRLPASTLTHQTHTLSYIQGKAYPIDCIDIAHGLGEDASLDRKIFLKISYFE